MLQIESAAEWVLVRAGVAGGAAVRGPQALVLAGRCFRRRVGWIVLFCRAYPTTCWII